jgi:hypothetical protein
MEFLYKDCSFCPNPLTNMAATGNSCFWLADLKQNSPLNQPIRNKNCLWWPCLLTDRDKMSNFYRGPSIDASYQVSVLKGIRLLRYVFSSPCQRQCELLPSLGIRRLLTFHILIFSVSNLYRGPSIDASYQISVHLVKWFQRRRFLKIGLSKTRIAVVYMKGPLESLLILSRLFNKHCRHRQFLFLIGWFLKYLLC